MVIGSRILLVDDDASLCELLIEYLQAEGFEPEAVHDGQTALQLLKTSNFDAVVLDIMMPRMSGLEVLQALRVNNSVPVIMLTGRGDDIDRIVGLEMGADDYLGKPCNSRELAARLRAVIRRNYSRFNIADADPTNVESLIEFNSIRLNTHTLEAHFNGLPANLTGAEFYVLLALMKSAGQILSKETLTREALHRKYTQYDRSIDVHISRIRHKLVNSGLIVDIIKSVRGVGYQMLKISDPTK